MFTEEVDGIVGLVEIGRRYKENISIESNMQLSVGEDIENLGFSVRTLNILRYFAGGTVKTDLDITKYSEKDFLRARNMGRVSVEEIKRVLTQRGLKLKE